MEQLTPDTPGTKGCWMFTVQFTAISTVGVCVCVEGGGGGVRGEKER